MSIQRRLCGKLKILPLCWATGRPLCQLHWGIKIDSRMYLTVEKFLIDLRDSAVWMQSCHFELTDLKGLANKLITTAWFRSFQQLVNFPVRVNCLLLCLQTEELPWKSEEGWGCSIVPRELWIWTPTDDCNRSCRTSQPRNNDVAHRQHGAQICVHCTGSMAL